MIVRLVQLPFSKTTKVGQFFIEQNQRVNRKIVRLVRLVRLYFTFLLTEKKFKFTSSKGVSFGEGIDFSKDFKKINSQKIAGEIQSE